MKFAEIVIIKEALEKISLGHLTFAFEIAKNLRICNKVIDETMSVVKDLQRQFLDKDERGEIMVHKDEKGQDTMKISDPSKLLQYQNAVRKLEEEEHGMAFLTIHKSKIEAEKFAAVEIIPLVDVIIIE